MIYAMLIIIMTATPNIHCVDYVATIPAGIDHKKYKYKNWDRALKEKK